MVLAEAILKTADLLGLSNTQLAAVIGLDLASMKQIEFSAVLEILIIISITSVKNTAKIKICAQQTTTNMIHNQIPSRQKFKISSG